jgi:hypothetical protein
METIGDRVSYRGQEYRVRGFDPGSVIPQKVYLEHVGSGRRLTVELQALRNPGPYLRLVEREAPGLGASDTTAPD